MLRDSKTNNTDNVNVEDASNLCCVSVEDCVPVVVIYNNTSSHSYALSDFLTWMFTSGGFTTGFRFCLRPEVSCETPQQGNRFKNRIKPVMDRNTPEEALREVETEFHVFPIFSVEITKTCFCERAEFQRALRTF